MSDRSINLANRSGSSLNMSARDTKVLTRPLDRIELRRLLERNDPVVEP